MVDVEKFEEGRRLHPLTLLHGSLISIPALAILMLPLLRGGNLYSSLLYLLFFLVASVPLWLVRYLRFRYWIKPDEIVIKSGVFTTQRRNIPIERVQNIEIERGVAARLMGLAKVKIQTAGSSGTEGALEYVSREEAQAIRETVRVFKRRVVAGETSSDVILEEEIAAEKSPAHDVLFAMSFDRLLTAGLFRFSLVHVLILFSALQYLNVDVEEIVDWFMLGRSETVALLAEASPFFIAIVTTLIVAATAWFTGLLLTINRFYRFELRNDPEEKIHIRYGLLTLAERTLPLKRIQAIVVRTNPLMRWFGWYRLEIQIMGLESEARGRHVVVPFARWHEIAEVLPELRPIALPESFTMVSGKTIRRYTIRAALLIAFVTAGLYLLWNEAIWLLALLPFGFYFAYCHYRTHGFHLTRDTFYVRRGVFREHLSMIPIDRAQAFFVQASFFQRRLGLASVYVDTAGASGGGQAVLSDVPTDVANELADILLDRFHDRKSAAPLPTEDAAIDLHLPEAPHP